MSFLSGLFTSSRALHVADGGVVSLADGLRSHHANQRATREWTVTNSTQATETDRHKLTKLALETPGLTVVRVRSDLDPSIAARVVASSDAPQHLERLTVSVKHKNELRVVFKNPTSDAPLGALVVELELASAALIDEIKATGGGDVVVVEQNGSVVLSRRDDANVTLVALDPHSRMFVLNDDMETPGIAAKSLRVASVSGGSVFVFTAHAVASRDHLASVVLGDGRSVIRTPSVETKELLVAVVGERGYAELLAPAQGIVATKAETVAFGGASILVQTSPQLERDPTITSCDRLKVDVAGGSCADVAALASREVVVKAKDGARAVVQPRERLEMTCEARSTVESVGGLPPRVDPAPQHIPVEMLLAVVHEARVWTASESVPNAPTPQMMYDAPRVLQVKKAGFRETLRPLWAAMQTHAAGQNSSAAAGGSPAQPAWVNVMGEVAGAGGAEGKSLD